MSLNQIMDKGVKPPTWVNIAANNLRVEGKFVHVLNADNFPPTDTSSIKFIVINDGALTYISVQDFQQMVRDEVEKALNDTNLHAK